EPRAGRWDIVVVIESSSLLDHFGERIERDALAVREAPPAQARRLDGRTAQELGDETRLPDAGRAEQREQVRGPLGDRPIERGGEHLELLVASDHRRVEMPLVPGRVHPNGDQTEGGHTVGLPLEIERTEGLAVARSLQEPVGRVAEQDLAGRGRLLEPRGDVDRIASNKTLT